jgi:hypothetical protein
MNDSLPGPEFWALLHPHTGDLGEVHRTARGFSSDLTAVVECEKGRFFVKAMRNRPGGRRDSIVREALINPYVVPVSPALQWRAEDGEWIALGFEAVAGRSSMFEPDSPDLPGIVSVLSRIGELTVPQVAEEWAETRWNRFTDDAADAALFEGGALLHTDINPSNLMIGDRTAWAVDWSWPTRGAAFIDPAILVLQLVAAGHSPASAESWAAHCPAWVNAEPKAIDAFALANLHMYEHLAQRKPDASWLAAMTTAARSWVNHRELTP